MALALTGIHELTVIRGYQRQSEAMEGNGRQSEAIKGNQRQSETIRGNERPSDAIRGNQRRSEVIRGDQRQSEVSVTVCACHYCVCGVGNTAPRFVNPNQLSVAPTNAAYGLAGLGLLGVETVNIRGAVGDGGFKEGMKGPLCAHQLEGCTVWPIFHHTHTYTHTHTLDPFGGHPEAQQQWVEVLGLATDGWLSIPINSQ